MVRPLISALWWWYHDIHSKGTASVIISLHDDETQVSGSACNPHKQSWPPTQTTAGVTPSAILTWVLRAILTDEISWDGAGSVMEEGRLRAWHRRKAWYLHQPSQGWCLGGGIWHSHHRLSGSSSARPPSFRSSARPPPFRPLAVVSSARRRFRPLAGGSSQFVRSSQRGRPSVPVPLLGEYDVVEGLKSVVLRCLEVGSAMVSLREVKQGQLCR